MIDDEPLTPWEKLQVLAVYNTLKRHVTRDRPNTKHDPILDRIAHIYISKRREQYPDRLDQS